jgi:hypothetical protein
MNKDICWVCNQFQNASNVVEYVSWLTASIFAVLAVFTIFIAHQYQNNTSEMIKLTWNIRSAITKKKIGELNELISNYEFYSKSPKAAKDAVDLSSVVIKVLVPIWGIAALSIISQEGSDQEGFNFVSIILILSVTIVFSYFSYKLIELLKTLTGSNSVELIGETKHDIQNIETLLNKDFEVDNIFKMESFKLKIDTIEQEPYLFISLEKDLEFYNYRVLVMLQTQDASKIALGSFVDKETKKLLFKVGLPNKRKINKIISNYRAETFSAYLVFYYENQEKKIVFKSSKITKIALNSIYAEEFKEINWEPPHVIEEDFFKNNHLEFVELRNI